MDKKRLKEVCQTIFVLKRFQTSLFRICFNSLLLKKSLIILHTVKSLRICNVTYTEGETSWGSQKKDGEKSKYCNKAMLQCFLRTAGSRSLFSSPPTPLKKNQNKNPNHKPPTGDQQEFPSTARVQALTYCPLPVKFGLTLQVLTNKLWQMMFCSREFYAEENKFQSYELENMTSDLPPD